MTEIDGLQNLELHMTGGIASLGIFAGKNGKPLSAKQRCLLSALKPNWEYWVNQDSWTLDEATHLVFGVEPSNTSHDNYDIAESHAGIVGLRKTAIASGIAGKLGIIKNGSQEFVNPQEFLRWALNKGVNEIPAPLEALLDSTPEENRTNREGGAGEEKPANDPPSIEVIGEPLSRDPSDLMAKTPNEVPDANCWHADDFSVVLVGGMEFRLKEKRIQTIIKRLWPRPDNERPELESKAILKIAEMAEGSKVRDIFRPTLGTDYKQLLENHRHGHWRLNTRTPEE